MNKHRLKGQPAARAHLNQKGATIIEVMISITIFSTILMVILYAFVLMGRHYFKSISINKTQAVTRNVVDALSESIRTSGVSINYLECRKVTQDSSGNDVDGGAFVAADIVGNSVATLSTDKITPCGERINYYKVDYWQGYCVGNVGYLFRQGYQLAPADVNKTDKEVFVVIRDCDPNKNAWENLETNRTAAASDKSKQPVELLQARMRLVEFTIKNDITPTKDDPGGTRRTVDEDLYQIHLKIAYGGDIMGDVTDSTATDYIDLSDLRSEERETFAYEEDTASTEYLPNDATNARAVKAKVKRCKINQIFCAVSELRTNAYRLIK